MRRGRGLSETPGTLFRQPLCETLESRRLLTVIPGFAESLVASGLNRPTQMDFAPDGRLFVSQQDGNLRVIKNGTLLSTPFVTVPAHNSGESGLIGVTFDPDFAANKFVYIYYTRPNGSGGYVNRVSRFTASGDVAVAGSEKVLIEGDTLSATNTWHQSGGLHFGTDGKLYISMGENNQRTPAQSLNTLLGKVLRINSDGTIPSDNPFYNQTTGKYRAIWAYGFRNPFTFAVQPGTGRTMVGDVGSDKWEELDELQKGANYGWPTTEGPTTNPAFKAPFYTYPHAGGDNDDSAITGVAFYNPSAISFPSDYVGDVFFGDYGLGKIQRIDLNTKQVSPFVSGVIEITDVDVASDGSLYYVTRDQGRVFRVRATTSSAPTIVVPPQSQTVAAGQPVTFSVTAGGSGLSYQWKRNNVDIPGATDSSYTIDPTTLADNNAKFRVTVSNTVSSITSSEATLTVIDDHAPTATITAPDDSFRWTGGGTISFAGTGTDLEDGDLPASAFTWEVVAHHNTHTHPFVPPYSGVKSDTIQISEVGEDDPDVWFRIHLTVRDSLGATATTFKDVFPKLINLSLQTEPAGLELDLGGTPVTTPDARQAVAGYKRTLSAPATQTLNGVKYAFDSWSDGGARTHDFNVPLTDTTYVAHYKVSTGPVTTTLRAAQDAYVRDGASAGTNFGNAADLQVKNDGGGRNRDSYLSFDLSSIGDDVTSAKLRLFAKLDNTTATNVPVSIFAGPSTWTESSITWNNKPAAGATQLASFTVANTTGKFYEIDLTSYFAAQKAAGATSATIVLKPGKASGATVVINSDEAASNRPELIVQTGGGGGVDPGPGPTTPTTLHATADTYARDGGSATTNFGAATELQIKKNSAVGYSRETYLKFDLSTLGTISNAKLRLFGHLTEAATVQTAVYLASDTSWSESGLTWNNRPPAGTTAAATASVSGVADKWYEWDLTALLQSEKAAGRNVVTLVLKNLTQTNATLVFASDEASANRPELVVS